MPFSVISYVLGGKAFEREIREDLTEYRGKGRGLGSVRRMVAGKFEIATAQALRQKASSVVHNRRPRCGCRWWLSVEAVVVPCGRSGSANSVDNCPGCRQIRERTAPGNVLVGSHKEQRGAIMFLKGLAAQLDHGQRHPTCGR